LVIGISGGIGSGKSAAARAFEHFGARVLNADETAHEVLGEPDVRSKIRSRFGESVFQGAEVDRGALANEVFGDSPARAAARADLEAIVHPRILERMQSEIAAIRSDPAPPPLVVIDAPLLIESPLLAACDEIVYVDAPEAVRLARTRERGWDAEHHRARERAQASLDRRRSAATRVLQNAGTREDLERACRALFEEWTRAG
jgi:dephospho-CoA kinase